jgi:hypothetical protein
MNHPITPPPELRGLWAQQAQRLTPHDITGWLDYVATQAARWGADQELEACCNYFEDRLRDGIAKDLRAARRPKPPSLKEQALEVVTGLEKRWDLQCDLTLLRRALEALPND